MHKSRTLLSSFLEEGELLVLAVFYTKTSISLNLKRHTPLG
jgi:hypothetical protein